MNFETGFEVHLFDLPSSSRSATETRYAVRQDDVWAVQQSFGEQIMPTVLQLQLGQFLQAL